MMNENVGSMDQYIRYLIGVVILIAGVAYQSIWGLIGIVPIITALLSWCPPYALLGIKTNKSAD
ncbi:MAG: DUF2892 domain-containing protein [Gammaproteobacteria bacterium]|nr:DUF2892 domain-containing protein [Gammaproteobacteria bacterium]